MSACCRCLRAIPAHHPRRAAGRSGSPQAPLPFFDRTECRPKTNGDLKCASAMPHHITEQSLRRITCGLLSTALPGYPSCNNRCPSAGANIAEPGSRRAEAKQNRNTATHCSSKSALTFILFSKCCIAISTKHSPNADN